jgi:hypothetical protein
MVIYGYKKDKEEQDEYELQIHHLTIKAFWID